MDIAITGHRPDKLGGYRCCNPVQQRVRRALRDALFRQKTLHDGLRLISGMALGVDQWAAEVCVELSIPFLAAVPCEGQDKLWPAASRQRYCALLGRAAEVVVVSPGPYESWKMQRRNEWMVDRCALLLAVWDGSSGGTANCVDYAERTGKPVERLRW